MHWLDWTIVCGFFACILAVANASRRHAKSVADFLVANRCAGRYLLTVADASAGIGTMFVIGNFEKIYHGGMAVAWWGKTLVEILFLELARSWLVKISQSSSL